MAPLRIGVEIDCVMKQVAAQKMDAGQQEYACTG